MFVRATPEDPLFSHLLSSRPPRGSKEDAAATALSVVFHAGLLTALVLATLTVGGVTPTLHPETLLVYLQPQDLTSAPRSVAPAVPGTIAAPGIAFEPPSFAPPTIIPFDYKGPAIGDIAPNDPAGIDEANRASIPGSSGTGPGSAADASHPFTVYTVEPELRNRTEVSRTLQRAYPPLLRDAGIGGTVIVWLLVDETGTVLRADVKQTSSHPALDDAAIKVALTMKFSPALNRDQKVKVWVALPIVFSAK
jgi:TonB family protein